MLEGFKGHTRKGHREKQPENTRNESAGLSATGAQKVQNGVENESMSTIFRLFRLFFGCFGRFGPPRAKAERRQELISDFFLPLWAGGPGPNDPCSGQQSSQYKPTFSVPKPKPQNSNYLFPKLRPLFPWQHAEKGNRNQNYNHGFGFGHEGDKGYLRALKIEGILATRSFGS